MVQFKKAKLNALDAFVRKVNFAKVSDKNVRYTLIKLIPAVSRAIKELEEDGKAMFDKFIGVFPEDKRMAYDTANRIRLEAMEKYQKSGNEEDLKAFAELNGKFSNDYKDIIEAVVSYDEAMKEFGEGDVELPVESIESEVFLDAMGDQCDITAETLDMLDPIIKL